MIRKDIPEFEVGDSIAVHNILREKGKERVQVFRGIVLAIKGSGLAKTFTIRKISSGIGVEKIFPFNSPSIKKIVFEKKGKVRRAKLYYMRKRIGRSAIKITEGSISESMKQQHAKLKKELEAEPDKSEKVAEVKPEDKENTEKKEPEKTK